MSLWPRPSPADLRRIRDLEEWVRHLDRELVKERANLAAAQLDLRTKEAQRLRELRSAAEELTKERARRSELEAALSKAHHHLAVLSADLGRAQFEPVVAAGASIPDLLRAWAARRPEGDGRTLLTQAASAILAYKQDAENQREFEPEWQPGWHIPDALQDWAKRRQTGSGRRLLELAAEALTKARREAAQLKAEREHYGRAPATEATPWPESEGAPVNPLHEATRLAKASLPILLRERPAVKDAMGAPGLIWNTATQDLRAGLASILAENFSQEWNARDCWADVLDAFDAHVRQEALDVLTPFLAGDQAANVTLDRILRVLAGRPALPEVPEALAKLREMAAPSGAARAHELADQVALALEGSR